MVQGSTAENGTMELLISAVSTVEEAQKNDRSQKRRAISPTPFSSESFAIKSEEKDSRIFFDSMNFLFLIVEIMTCV